jgi:AmmeMemoRadiSam system protein B
MGDRDLVGRRSAAVAGSFYAGAGARLAADVDRYLAEAVPDGPDRGSRRAVVTLVPHAGLVA